MVEVNDLHESVMLPEALNALNVQPDGRYVDATFGRGGHARQILSKLKSGRLMVIDKDPQAIALAKAWHDEGQPIDVKHGSFSALSQFLFEQEWDAVDGILFDLGVSSPQLDDPERGFSFTQDGPLDMRMDPTSGISAAQWVNETPEAEIAQALKTYGEERFAKRIAHKIVQVRAEKPIETTLELVEIIKEAQPVRDKHKHPATRSFQAIRMVVNQELDDITQALKQAIAALKKGGRLVVISFHSLEDRLVKQTLKAAAKGDVIPHFIPVRHEDVKGDIKLLGKQKPSDDELAHNPRSRSAILRVAEKQ